MTEATPRFALPFILPGQAQKEMFHNEALLRLDIVSSAAVEQGPVGAAPADPQEGQCWIVAEGASGDWAGKDHSLACWTSGGWRFVAPQPGMSAWNKADGLAIFWIDGAWTSGQIICTEVVIDGRRVIGPRQPAPPSPSGGTIIDAEARSSIDLIIATLMSHGLID